MNFKSAIKKLSKNEAFITVKKDGGDYLLVRSDEIVDGKNSPQYFAINMANSEAIVSSLACIRKAHRLDPKTGQPIILKGQKEPKVFAVKIFDRGSNEHEAEFTRQYTGTGIFLKKIDGKQMLISEFVPGSDLVDLKSQVAPDLQLLSFSQRINLICQHALSLNLMHHNTPSTGPAIVHADIKGPNVKVYIKKPEEKVDTKNKSSQVMHTEIFPLDFGTAQTLEKEDDRVKTPLIGTPYMIAPEVIRYLKDCPVVPEDAVTKEMTGEKGPKSDIYATAALYMTILGATSVYGNRISSDLVNQKFMLNVDLLRQQMQNGFDTRGLFEGLDIIKFGFELRGNQVPEDFMGEVIKSLVKDFLLQMCSLNYDERHDSDETLRFFNTLNNLCKLADNKSSNQNEYIILFAKLLLIKYKLWNFSQEVYDANERKLVKYSYSFENLNFDDVDNFGICQNIVGAFFDNEKLDIDILQNANIALPSPENNLLDTESKIASAVIKKLKNADLYEEKFISRDGLLAEEALTLYPEMLTLSAGMLRVLITPEFLKTPTANSDPRNLLNEFLLQGKLINKIISKDVYNLIMQGLSAYKNAIELAFSKDVSQFILKNDEERVKHLSAMSNADKLELLNEIQEDQKKAMFIQLSNPEIYDKLNETIANSLLSKTQDYLRTIEHLPDSTRRGSRFGCTVGVKKESVKHFIAAIKTGNIGLLFTDKKSQINKALRQGALKDATADIMKLIEKNNRNCC